MTVKQLIAELGKYDPSLTVVVFEPLIVADVVEMDGIYLQSLIKLEEEKLNACWLHNPKSENVLLLRNI